MMRFVTLLRLTPLAAAAFLSVATSAPATTPEPDSCEEPVDGLVLDAIEIGPRLEDGAPFEAWEDGDFTQIVHGDQGGAMTPIRLRFIGANVPDCLLQTTIIRDASGGWLTEEQTPLATYDAGDGTRVTNTLWVIYPGYPPSDGTDIIISTEAGGQTVTRTLHVGQAP